MANLSGRASPNKESNPKQEQRHGEHPHDIIRRCAPNFAQLHIGGRRGGGCGWGRWRRRRIGCGLVAALAKKLVEASGQRPADRALGALFGAVRAGVILLVTAVLAQLTPLHQSDWWHASDGAPWLVDC